MFDFYTFLGLVACGYIFGVMAERRHYASIHKRELATISLPTTNAKRALQLSDIPPSMQRAELVTGSVVISVDYFKRLLAGLRNFFGGTVTSYESLLDRARREAILRMKEAGQGAEQIINVRIETSSISKGEANSVGSVEVLAYGTAIFTARPSQQP